MSTTMPFASIAAQRNSTSTTKVAPCSRCAGPKTSPRKLCAIMTWSRTPTVNMPLPPLPAAGSGARVAHPLAEHAGRVDGKPRDDLRERGERHVAADQALERGIAQQLERLGEPAGVAPARAGRRGDRADLRAQQAQAAAVEGLAERQRHLAVAVPAQLQDPGLEAGDLQRAPQARGVAAGVD